MHRAAYPTRCFFVDTTLWTEPALAPTAVIPKLPESRGAACGYEQLELGDEEQLARYPVLQAIRSGIKLDTESYTRGNYQTVPIVPGECMPQLNCNNLGSKPEHTAHCFNPSAGGSAWTKVVPALDGAKPEAWLQEYQSDALPSVHIEALGESCFSKMPADKTEATASIPSAAQSAEHQPGVPLGPSLTSPRVLTVHLPALGSLAKHSASHCSHCFIER